MLNKRILFSLISEKGHINPMMGVAQYLEKEGYELAFFSQTDITKTLRSAGLKAKCYFDTSELNWKKKFISTGQQLVEGLKQRNWSSNWIKTLLIDSVPTQKKLIHSVIKEFQPEIIVTDPMVYAAAIAAQEVDIPWVGLSSSLNPVTPLEWKCDLTEILDDLNSLRVELFRNLDPPTFRVSDLISPWLNIVFTTEEYMSREACKNDFSFYLGSSLAPFPRGDEVFFPMEKLKVNTKKVYMSLGSQIYYHPQLFLAVAEALNDKDIQLILSINKLIDTPLIDLFPSNVIPFFYAPQLQLLKTVDLVITHGGANSVMESLAHGIPIAMFPICNDQLLQSKFMKLAGVGVDLDASKLCVDSYRSTLLSLLDEECSEKLNAVKIGESFKNYGGAFEGANLIKRLITEKKALFPPKVAVDYLCFSTLG